MVEQIISVDYETKETIKVIIQELELCECNIETEAYLLSALVKLEKIKKRMRTFKK